MGQRSYIQNLQPIVIHDERVAELDGHALRVTKSGAPISAVHFRRQRILDIHDNEAAMAQDVRVVPGDGDAPRAIEHSAGIERRALS